MYVLHRLFPLYLSFHLIFSETWIFNPASSTRYVHPMCNENKKTLVINALVFLLPHSSYLERKKLELDKVYWKALTWGTKILIFTHLSHSYNMYLWRGKGGSPNAYIYCLDCIIAIVLYVQGWEGKWGSNFAILLYTFNNRLSLGSEDPSSPKWLKM